MAEATINVPEKGEDVTESMLVNAYELRLLSRECEASVKLRRTTGKGGLRNSAYDIHEEHVFLHHKEL